MYSLDSIKDLFKNIRFSDLEIKSLISLKAKMEESALNLNSNISEKVSGSKNSEGVYGIVDGYVDLEKIISDKSKSLFENKRKALDIVKCLDNPVHRIVLIERYLNSQSWKCVSILISRSEKYVRTKLHSEALRACEKLKISR